MPTILLIDDDPHFSELLQEQLQPLGHGVHWLDSAEDGLRHLAENAADVVLLDNKMPRMSGLEFLAALREHGLRARVILMTGEHNDGTAIDAIAGGAFKYVIKPLRVEDIPRVFGPLIVRALEDRPALAEPEPKPHQAYEEDDSLIVGRSEPMLAMLESIGELVRVDDPVLILGETGTGKDLVARKLHQHSRRSAAPYVAICCPSIPEQLLESELFGHEKGAFTGADRRRVGKFEHCDGGTLFLDEIGEMAPNTQSKILRVLQDQSFTRLGGNESIRTDVRIVAATNVDLKAAAASGRFRADLYYRLNTYTIHVPPLRKRGDDLPRLVQHFVRRFSRQLDRDVYTVSEEALEAMSRYPWPGNVRELQSVLKQALLRAKGPVLLRSFLPPLVAGDGSVEAMNQEAALAGLVGLIAWLWNHEPKDLWPKLEALTQKELLRHALAQLPRESELKLAERLGIAKNTLRAWRKEYRLDETVKDDSVTE